MLDKVTFHTRKRARKKANAS